VARGRGGWGKSVFFCPSDVLSPYFSEYTNDEPLKMNFRFIDSTPQSHFGAISPHRLTLQLLTQSWVWNYHITCIEFLINNTSISYRLNKQSIFFKWRCNRLYNIFALASMQIKNKMWWTKDIKSCWQICINEFIQKLNWLDICHTYKLFPFNSSTFTFFCYVFRYVKINWQMHAVHNTFIIFLTTMTCHISIPKASKIIYDMYSVKQNILT
jgi:hypothetical protein